MNVWGPYRNDLSDPGLTDQNPGALNRSNTGGSRNRAGFSSNGLDLFSIPTQGLRNEQPTAYGDIGAGIGNGYAGISHSTMLGDGPGKLNLAAQVNPDSALGRAGLGIRHNNLSCRGDTVRERRGGHRDLESANESFLLTDSMLRARAASQQELRAIEAWDYSAGVYSLSVPTGSLPKITPRLSYTWADERSYRSMMQLHASREKLGHDTVASHASLSALAARRPRQIWNHNVTADVPQAFTFDLGDTLIKRGHRTTEPGCQIGAWNSYIGASVFWAHKYYTQVEIKEAKRAEVLLTNERERGARGDFLICCGIRGFLRQVQNTSYRQGRNYSETHEGQSHLTGAESDFYKKPIPAMNLPAVVAASAQPKGLSVDDVQATGGLLGIENSLDSSLTWRIHVLPARPGFMTVWGRDKKSSAREEIEVRYDGETPEHTQRFINSRKVSKQVLSNAPIVRDVSAAEEWTLQPSSSQRNFRKLRFAANWHARAPQSPEALNKVIKHYNALFGLNETLLDTSAGAMKATRRIRLDIELGAADIDRLGDKLLAHDDLAELAQQKRLRECDVMDLRHAFAASTSLETRGEVLRKFVAKDGVRAMALLHNLNGELLRTLDISADESIYDNALAFGAQVLMRYPGSLNDKVTIKSLQNRLYDVRRALRFNEHAIACIDKDSMVGPLKRAEKIERLKQDAAKLRASCEIDSDNTLRNEYYQALTSPWFMTEQDCEYAAVFQKVQELGAPYTKQVTSHSSAIAYLRHYDEAIQTLGRVRIGTLNNILFTPTQRDRHIKQIDSAVAVLKQEFETQLACEQAQPYLVQPWKTYGFFWFTHLRGWRYFWQHQYDRPTSSQPGFAPTDMLAGV